MGGVVRRGHSAEPAARRLGFCSARGRSGLGGDGPAVAAVRRSTEGAPLGPGVRDCATAPGCEACCALPGSTSPAHIPGGNLKRAAGRDEGASTADRQSLRRKLAPPSQRKSIRVRRCGARLRHCHARKTPWRARGPGAVRQGIVQVARMGLGQLAVKVSSSAERRKAEDAQLTNL